MSGVRARELAHARHPRGVVSDAITPHVTTHPVWGVLSTAGGALVLLSGVLIAWRGGRWAAMAARYEAPAASDPAAAERLRARADASLWTALERGDDPTARDPRDAH